jgi:hypothetical protein
VRRGGVRRARGLRRGQLVSQHANDDVGVAADGFGIRAHECAGVEARRQALEVAFLDPAQVRDADAGPAAYFRQAQALGHPGFSQLSGVIWTLVRAIGRVCVRHYSAGNGVRISRADPCRIDDRCCWPTWLPPQPP